MLQIKSSTVVRLSYLGTDAGLAIKEAVKRDAVPLVGAVELLSGRLETMKSLKYNLVKSNTFSSENFGRQI